MIREHFRPLPVLPLREQATLYQSNQSFPEAVTLESPALDVMTDLTLTPAHVVDPAASVEEANARMIRQAVRLLFVTDARRHLLGIITATDILGNRTMQVMLARGVARPEVSVREVMTSRERLEAIDIQDVRGAKVGHILATLKEAGRQHALVVEVDSYEPTLHERLTGELQAYFSQRVRGLFSATQIARQLGLQPQPGEIATTFAEVESMLAH